MRKYLGEIVGAGLVALAVLVISDDWDFIWKYLIILGLVFLFQLIQARQLPRLKRPLATLLSPGGQSFLRMATVSAALVWWFAPTWVLALVPLIWFFGRWFLVLDNDELEKVPSQ